MLFQVTKKLQHHLISFFSVVQNILLLCILHLALLKKITNNYTARWLSAKHITVLQFKSIKKKVQKFKTWNKNGQQQIVILKLVVKWLALLERLPQCVHSIKVPVKHILLRQ